MSRTERTAMMFELHLKKIFLKCPKKFPNTIHCSGSKWHYFGSEYPRDGKIFFIVGSGTRASLASHAERGWLQRMPRGLKSVCS